MHCNTVLLMCRAARTPGRSVVLLAGGERSCRTCLDPQVSFPGSCLQPQQLQGAAWLFVSGYAAYQEGLLLQAVRMAKQVGHCAVSPSLASSAAAVCMLWFINSRQTLGRSSRACKPAGTCLKGWLICCRVLQLPHCLWQSHSAVPYKGQLLPSHSAPHLTLQSGVRVALDLASWEVLQLHWDVIKEALLSGCVDLCFCNQVCKMACAAVALSCN
jgi:hypothetical protein